MTIRNLDVTLEPASIAVVGASERKGTVGEVMIRNILDGGFAGPVWPVNPHRTTVAGLPCFPDPSALPGAPDLAVVAVPPAALPASIAALGARGCRAAVVASGGIGMTPEIRQATLDAARPHLLRVIGPNTVGLVVPGAKLNASFARGGASAGSVALVSQSGAIAAAMVDWAVERGIGLSQVVALGDMADVDVADWLDLLAGDWHTRVILLALESVPQARKFLSAARAAARVKPVIALKAGRSPQAAQAVATHTGALAGEDAVVEAALRRAGILRVRGLAEMFSAAETLGRFRPMSRARLAIVTNGGGAGVLAVDRLMEGRGVLADLGPATIERLDQVLPATWSHGNPVDIIEDADSARYVAALSAVADDPGTDAILVMHCPTALSEPVEAAEAVSGLVERGQIGRKPLLACWIGGTASREARRLLRARGVAAYDAPAAAAAAVGHLTDWGRAQAALMHVPDRQAEEALAQTPPEARAQVAAIFATVAAEGRTVLTEPESIAVLAAYGIPAPCVRVERTPEAVGAAAAEMLAGGAGRLVVKLESRAISHKSDVGGVVLDVASQAEAEAAARSIAGRLAARAPEASLDGFTLQPMIRRRDALELIVGVGRDPVFGPVILFGAGGLAVEYLEDTAVALPPLDAALAAALVARTRVGAQLAGFRGRAPADADAIHNALVALSHLVEDFPCLRAVDVNPLVADAEGVLALDATIEIDPTDSRLPPNPDLAIRPYPGSWRRAHEAHDGTYVLRPVQPVDALSYDAFWKKVDPDDIRRRFLAPRARFTQQDSLRLTQLDYDREMAFVAIAPDGSLAGVSRIAADPDHRTAEYALLVRSDMQGRGLGSGLMQILIDYARADGIERLDGIVLAENSGMLRLIRRLGFVYKTSPEDPALVDSWLDLAPAPAEESGGENASGNKG